MVLLFSFTALVILLYLAYPLWLACLKPVNEIPVENPQPVECVSLILLSYNGGQFLKEKIDFLLKELSAFKDSELLVIDDCSNDGSREILGGFQGNHGIKIVQKEHHNGIPDSMNTAVGLAQFEYIVFCDQRQQLSENIIVKLLESFKDERVGAVSACISDHDKSHHFSWIRAYENHVKCMESKTGSLIGVYGPLYAVRKSRFSPIPNHIVLDDLYLSLRILANSQVRIMKECLVTDDSHAILNDYGRAKRYILGFLQLMNEKGIVSALNTKQRVMLYWHKYLRLHIPLLLLASYLGTGIMSFFNPSYINPFIIITVLMILLSLPAKFSFHLKLKNMLKINAFYLVAFIEVNAVHYLKLNKKL